MDRGQIKLLTGRTCLAFAQSIAQRLDTNLIPTKVKDFASHEIWCQFVDSVRGTDLFIIQAPKTSHDIVETLILCDAALYASASRITFVLPCLPYARQDRKDLPHTPITANLILRLCHAAGANRLLTMQLHNGQIQGFYDPRLMLVEQIFGTVAIIKGIKEIFPDFNRDNTIIAAADKNAGFIAGYYADFLDLSWVPGEKKRDAHNHVESILFFGLDQFKGKNVWLIDDLVDTGGTLAFASKIIMDAGANSVSIIATHALFSNDCLKKLQEAQIEKIIVGNTIPLDENVIKNPKVVIIDMTESFALAINAIHRDESVSALDIFHK